MISESPSLFPGYDYEEAGLIHQKQKKVRKSRGRRIFTPSLFETDENPDNIRLYNGPEMEIRSKEEKEDGKKQKLVGSKPYWLSPRQLRTLKTRTICSALKIIKECLLGKKLESKDLEDIFRKKAAGECLMKVVINKETGEPIHQKNIVSVNGHVTGSITSLFGIFKAIGLIYVNDYYIFCFTEVAHYLVGLDVEKNSKEIEKILAHLFCKIQYPSEYFRNSHVRIDPKIKIKPVLFLVKLLSDSRISYLTKNELSIVYNKAKTYGDLNATIKAIEDFRRIPDPQTIKNLPDTTKECCLDTLLVSRKILKVKSIGCYVLNKENPQYFLIKKYAEQYDRDPGFILSIKKHGELEKSSRVIVLQHDADAIEQNLLDLCGKYTTLCSMVEKIVEDYSATFCKAMLDRLHEDPEKYLACFSKTVVSYFLDSFNKNRDAELAILDILNNRYKFPSHDTAKLINKGPEGGRFSDILVPFEKQNCCGIIDSKTNNKGRFALNGEMQAKMVMYALKNYNLLQQLNLPSSLKIAFICYISSGYHKQEKNIETLQSCLQRTVHYPIPVSIMNIEDFEKVSTMNLTPDFFVHIMRKGGGLTWRDFKPAF